MGLNAQSIKLGKGLTIQLMCRSTAPLAEQCFTSHQLCRSSSISMWMSLSASLPSLGQDTQMAQ